MTDRPDLSSSTCKKQREEKKISRNAVNARQAWGRDQWGGSPKKRLKKVKENKSNSEDQPVGGKEGGQWKCTSTWWDPVSPDQSHSPPLKAERHKTKSQRATGLLLGMSRGWTAALLPFSEPAAKTFNRMSSRYQPTATLSLPASLSPSNPRLTPPSPTNKWHLLLYGWP